MKHATDTKRFPVRSSSRTFAVGDRVSRGVGGERGVILYVAILSGHAEALDVEWDGPPPHREHVTGVRFIVPVGA